MNRFRSNLERRFHAAHPTLGYETTRLPYVLRHTYTPDWTISETAYVETKGLWTGADRQKVLQVKKQHPDVTVLMAFENPHRRLSKAPTSVTYAQWCERHDIPWCGATDAAAVTAFIAAHTKITK